MTNLTPTEVSIILALFGAGFTAWAAVVAWGTRRLIKQLDDLGNRINDMQNNFYKVHTTVEVRLSAIESRVGERRAMDRDMLLRMFESLQHNNTP